MSKLIWPRDAGSELQRRDVRALLAGSVEKDYLKHWAMRLGVAEQLSEDMS